MKTCSTCGVEKTIDSFYHYKRNKDGHLGVCKRCFLARKAENEGKRRAGHRWLWVQVYQGSPRAGMRGSYPARGGTS